MVMSYGYWSEEMAGKKKVVKKVDETTAVVKPVVKKKVSVKKVNEVPVRKRKVLRMARIAKKYRSPRKRN